MIRSRLPGTRRCIQRTCPLSNHIRNAQRYALQHHNQHPSASSGYEELRRTFLVPSSYHHRDTRTAAAASDGQPLGSSNAAWEAETLKRMLQFMAPAMVLPIADPLMSVVDTICIGQVSATARSLGPPLIPSWLFTADPHSSAAAVCRHPGTRSTGPSQPGPWLHTVRVPVTTGRHHQVRCSQGMPASSCHWAQVQHGSIIASGLTTALGS